MKTKTIYIPHLFNLANLREESEFLCPNCLSYNVYSDTGAGCGIPMNDELQNHEVFEWKRPLEPGKKYYCNDCCCELEDIIDVEDIQDVELKIELKE